ncbi:MAG TPA: hypothetical protein VN726_22940 [Hanamia sp.]|nr:hypothetical protein [Hanamia sp.]
MEPPIHCPKCNSTQITANKKGFSGTKAFGGAVLTGGIGLLAGTIGSNKIKITCLACGHEFKPGDRPKTEEEIKYRKRTSKVLILIFGFAALYALGEGSYGFFIFWLLIALAGYGTLRKMNE